MKRIVMCMAFGMFLTSSAVAGDGEQKTELTDGREILQKAQAAVKQVKTVSYRADYKGTKWVAAFVPTVQGTAVLGEKSKWDLNRFRCEVKLQKTDSTEVLELTAGSDGELFFLIDPKTKMAHEDIDPAVLGSNERNLQRVLMREFSAPEPFSDELKAESIELKGTTKIGEEECYEVNVKTESPPELIWYISKEDFLPRKVIRIYPNPQDAEAEKGTTELTITDLVVNPKFGKDPFKLVVPEGFTKTDEFAP